MKKKLLTAIFIMILGCSSLFAQKDGFFTSNYSEYREDNGWGMEMPLLPGSHGYHGDFSCEEVPLGNGLLLLVAFAVLRGRKSDD